MERIRNAILEDRYFMSGYDFSENDVWERVSNSISEVYSDKKLKNLFFEMMSEKRFLPNSPTIFNALPKKSFMGSACFVIDIEDSMDGIMNAASEMATIFKYGGGVGASLDKLRPKGALVSDNISESSGPVSFMHIFDAVSKSVMQGGKRRAALLLNLSVYHPDIIDFITCKKNNDSLNMMNISVKLDKNFLDKVKKNEEITLFKFPTYKGKEKYSAKEIYDLIIEHMWKNGEPGILFIDNIEEYNPIPSLPILSTNPCGEQPLHLYSSCNLGSINLNHPDCINDKEVNYSYIENLAYLATYFLNGVIVKFEMKIQKFIENVKKKIRPIGLGVTGFSELLMKLNIPYGSPQCMKIIDDIGVALCTGSTKASIDLTSVFGKFELYNSSLWASKKTRHKMLKINDSTLFNLIEKKGLSNATLTCIAPTGTISILLNSTTSGIEPPFSLITERKFLRRNGEWESDIIKVNSLPKEIKEEDIIKNNGSLKGLIDDPHIFDIYRTALEISPKEHIDVQAKWQQYIHAAISKTINLPTNSTQDQIKDLCFYAHENKCKGFTVYRDLSREFQVLSTLKEKDNTINVVQRPVKVKGDTYRVEVNSSSIYLTFNCWNEKLKEVFLNVTKQGNEFSVLCSSLGRILSIALQHGVSIERIANTLKGHRGDLNGMVYLEDKATFFTSLPDLVGKILLYYKNDENISKNEVNGIKLKLCPNCLQSFLIKESENCYHCNNCNYSSCN